MSTRLVAAAMLVLLALSLLGPAYAAPSATPTTTQELLDAYGIADQPSDFVVVVDTSSSMMDSPPIYPDVRRVFADFTDAIGDRDHLGVITFDSSAVVRFNGTLETPDKRAAAKAALPPEARGGRTDIGAAMDAALERIERADAAQVQTLIFLTDGQIQAPGSPFGTPGSPAWKDLRARADRLSQSRTVSVLGAGLGGKATDVGVVQDVFPRAKTVSVPADQLPQFFGEAVERARVERLRVPVEQELNRYGVQAAVGPAELTDLTRLGVRLNSALPHLGATVNVRGVEVTTADGTPLEARLSNGPQPVTLPPGATSEPVPVDVVVPDLDHSFKIGQTAETAGFRVNLLTDTEVEPAAILARELGIETPPRLTQPPLAEASRQRGVPYWLLAVWLGIAALVLWIFSWFYHRFFGTPPLRGILQVANSAVKDGEPQFVRLHGRVLEIPNKHLLIDGDPIDTGGATVRFSTRRGKFAGLSTRHPRIWAERIDGSPELSPSGATAKPFDGATPIGLGDSITMGPTTIKVAFRGSTGR